MFYIRFQRSLNEFGENVDIIIAVHEIIVRAVFAMEA
jgi:hypothetical protein